MYTKTMNYLWKQIKQIKKQTNKYSTARSRKSLFGKSTVHRINYLSE